LGRGLGLLTRQSCGQFPTAKDITTDVRYTRHVDPPCGQNVLGDIPGIVAEAERLEVLLSLRFIRVKLLLFSGTHACFAGLPSLYIPAEPK
jgi:hypothetical protein